MGNKIDDISKNENISENRKCALQLNSLIFDLQREGITHNGLINGLLFALSIQMLNYGLSFKDVLRQFKKLYFSIKKEVEEDSEEDTEDLLFVSQQKPINDEWN